MKITIEIDMRQKGAKALLEFIKSLPFIKIVNTDKSKDNKTLKEFRQALREVKNAQENNTNLIDAKKLIDEL